MKTLIRRWFGTRPPARPPRDVEALVSGCATPAVRLIASGGTPTRSHFGGAPRLPAGIAWPTRNGRRLAPLARLSLAELHAAQRIDWLPNSGALLFFYDVEEQPWGFDPQDRGAWAVLHVDDLGEPVLAQGESGRNDDAGPRNVSLRCVRIESLPSAERAAIATLDLTDAESEAYADLVDARFGGEPQHQVGGFPNPIQSDGMELEAQLASHGVYCGEPKAFQSPAAAALAPGATDWRLLLQFDSDDELETMWGDGGRLYFWVQEAQARAGRFDDAWLVLQCT